MNSPSDGTTSLDDLLSLSSVLEDTLPATLLTATAPERYTVDAVFNRRPSQAEIDRILDPTTLDALADEGYPQIRLAVSDRRLEIHHTNLEELRDGLSSLLGDHLATISTAVQAQDDAEAAESQRYADRELERATAVGALVASISFDPNGPRPSSPTPQPSPAEAGQISDWVEEGGAVAGA